MNYPKTTFPANDAGPAPSKTTTHRNKCVDSALSPGHPDANLIRLGNTLAVSKRILDVLSQQFADDDEPTVVAVLARDLVAQGQLVCTQMARTPAKSLDGLRAKAAALICYSGSADGRIDCSTVDELIGRSIAIDLLELRINP